MKRKNRMMCKYRLNPTVNDLLEFMVKNANFRTSKTQILERAFVCQVLESCYDIFGVDLNK